MRLLHETPWIAPRAAKPRARLRLFCLPYAGGSAVIYRGWQAAFPQDVDVCSIELPGRMSRLDESPARSVTAVVESLNVALAPYLDLPFALFGYSMGALLAFEWARALEEEAGLAPEHLVVAAHQAPQLPARHVRAVDATSDADLLARIVDRYGPRIQAIVADPELVALVLRVMRADLTLLDSYRFREGLVLRAPITVLGGLHDSAVAAHRLGEWMRHTLGSFEVRTFPGDHFFLHAHEPAVRAAVLGALQPEVASATAS